MSDRELLEALEREVRELLALEDKSIASEVVQKGEKEDGKGQP
jgi:hypothetical protein